MHTAFRAPAVRCAAGELWRKNDGTSQSTRALLRLRELILNGEFAPGTRMSELPLVERLGVSRTPLRLALATLEHEGLLELVPGGRLRGAASSAHADVNDAIELRGVLEGTAARMAAERGVSRRELMAMRTAIDRMDVEVQAGLRLVRRLHGDSTRASTRCS